ncbi:MAG: hypothetical protein ACXWNJ_18110, partial [Vulcanimicrobiaceae bacterium]
MRAWLADETQPRALIVSGLAGIGKTALVAEALRAADGQFATVETVDAPQRTDAKRVIVCARPEMLPFAREAYADAAEIALGPLPRGDFSLALARRFADGSVQRVADA